MRSALIGYTGFVGTTLRSQTDFTEMFRSTDIQNIQGREYDFVISAGAPARKWYANAHPEEDLDAIKRLIGYLDTMTARTFVLISTVDVFKSPVGVDERSPITKTGLHPYGYHRLLLEQFVAKKFPKSLIVRLPGLVGAGLKKNILFDFLNDNNVHLIESRNVFQFYPMRQLWKDIHVALDNELRLIHLTAAPVDVRTVAQECFRRDFANELDRPLVKYDMKTVYASLWGRTEYQYSREESLRAILDYAATEPRSLCS
ncbi:hypothetical protein [uncultured Mailhella sp.]|uniref:hypothetical protein n=1 Tax=uncultured Mailhella sp. TaxID=1981031 RepID=UPI00262E989C|nr:hypothetical protein [uncultured Mailhella sp.]